MGPQIPLGIRFLIACILGLGGSMALAQPEHDSDRPRPPMLTVTGNGEAAVRPDQATVRLGAVAQASQASDAQQQVNEVMTRAIDDIRRLGIPEESISTSGLALHPIYTDARPRPGQEHPREPQIAGYRASNSVRVIVDELAKVGEVIDAGVNAGANQVEGLSFGLKDDTAARSEALRGAARQARAKADAIAEAMNLKVDGVVEVNEGGVQVYPRNFDAARGLMAAEAGTPVQPGQVQVSATVTVAYRISAK